MDDVHGFFNRKKGILAAYIFLLAFILRVALNLIFFLRSGWFASHLIEIWFYYGVARGVFSLSLLDPTYLLLSSLGRVLPAGILYQAVAFEGALISALTSVFIFYWLSNWSDRKCGWWGGIIFALLPAPLSLSLANFSHDLVQVPVVVLFFWCAGMVLKEEGGIKKRVVCAFLAAFLLLLGIKVGPLMAAALLVVIFYAFWCFLRAIFPARLSSPVALFFLLFLVAGNLVLLMIMKSHLLQWITPLALKFRGIDLAAQVKIMVGDLQPLPPDGLWNRYNLFLFFLPWGWWIAFRKREFLSLALFLFSLVLALTVNRGARLLDISVAVLAGLAFSHWNSRAKFLTVLLVILFLSIQVLSPEVAGSLRLKLSHDLLSLWKGVGRAIAEKGFLPEVRFRFGLAFLLSGFLLLVLGWSFSLAGKKKWMLAVMLLATVLGEGGWVILAGSTSSDQLEYEAYRWLNERSQKGEKIFAAWNQGFFIQAVTHLEPITTPDRIDFGLTRIYWEEEETAWRELKRRGVGYVHISTRYFAVTEVDRERDTFNMRGNTIIGPRPTRIRRFSRLRRTFLYLLNYEPQRLTYFRLIYAQFDPQRRIGVRIFAL